MRAILFVCTANICRSPTAAGVFRKILARKDKEDAFEGAATGRHEYHVGTPLFPTAVEVGKQRGYDIKSPGASSRATSATST